MAAPNEVALLFRLAPSCWRKIAITLIDLLLVQNRPFGNVNECKRLITEVTAQPLPRDAKKKPPRHRAAHL